MSLNRKTLTLAIHWIRFGPYHIARLEATAQKLSPLGIHVVGIEVANQDKTYGWDQEKKIGSFSRYVALSEDHAEDVFSYRLWAAMWSLANQIRPDVICIAGYNTVDALALLAWCKLHRRTAILMTESKYDDFPRSLWKEWIKSKIVKLYPYALCGGIPHIAYLERLGMSRDRLFDGYDVIDNSYFQHQSLKARQNPETVRHLPGLEESNPFFLASSRFIKRKNLDYLLLAYKRYRDEITQSGLLNRPWRLVLLGDGEERATLEALVKTQEIEGVTFAGFKQIFDLPAYYGLAGAFIHSALVEPWGLVVNEAMASGVPVIVSNQCGCVPDLIIEGKTGLTFDPQDIQKLTDCMIQISSQQIDVQTLISAAHDHIADWDIDRFTRGLSNAIKNLL